MKALVLIISGLLTFVLSCTSMENQNTKQPIEDKIKEVFGRVEKIEDGPDGYTAMIKTSKGELHFAIISIPNLGEEAYKNLEIGKKVALKGEYWKLGEENRLTVRKILSTNNDHFEVSGKMKSVNQGTDGYTAELIADDGEIYFATVSIPNLGNNHEKYKEFKFGETLTVVGELWALGSEKQVTVRDILPSKKEISAIANFDECYIAGGDIMERYPRMCSIGNQVFEETLGPKKKGDSIKRIFKVDAERPTCQGAHPFDQECLIVNGQYFYSNIEGFQHEKGNEYVIAVSQTMICDPDVLNDCPQDVGIYDYKLLEIISRRRVD